MHRYRLCDFALESNIPFHELPSAGAETHEFAFRLDLPQRASRRQTSWIARHRTAAGRIVMELGVESHGWVLRFPGLADFRISSDTRDIRAYRHRPMPLGTLRHLLLDQVLPLVLSRRSRLVLQAGAVDTPHGAIALLGRPGIGKSTLVASLARAGFPLIADDFLLMRDDMVAVPSYPGLRLWSDAAAEMFGDDPKAVPVAHYTSKIRCGVGRAVPFATGPARLSRVYVLAGAPEIEAVRLLPVAGSEAFAELQRHSYRFDAGDRDLLRREAEMHRALLRAVTFRRLEYPRNFAALAAVRAAILEDLASTPGLS